MNQNQKIVLLLGAAGIVAYLIWKSRKPVVETGLGKEKMQCEEEFLSANHPDVARTPEEQEAYKKNCQCSLFLIPNHHQLEDLQSLNKHMYTVFPNLKIL